MLTIAYLYDYPNYVSNVSRWLYDLYDELTHIDEEAPDYQALYSYFRNNSKTELPIRLVAISDGACVGTVTLIDNDFSGKAYTPWLGGLHVDIQHRGHGIGQRLIEFAQQLAKTLGYCELYLGTENAGHYYQNLGWTCVETCANDAGQASEIYRYNL